MLRSPRSRQRQRLRWSRPPLRPMGKSPQRMLRKRAIKRRWSLSQNCRHCKTHPNPRRRPRSRPRRRPPKNRSRQWPWKRRPPRSCRMLRSPRSRQRQPLTWSYPPLRPLRSRLRQRPRHGRLDGGGCGNGRSSVARSMCLFPGPSRNCRRCRTRAYPRRRPRSRPRRRPPKNCLRQRPWKRRPPKSRAPLRPLRSPPQRRLPKSRRPFSRGRGGCRRAAGCSAPRGAASASGRGGGARSGGRGNG